MSRIGTKPNPDMLRSIGMTDDQFVAAHKVLTDALNKMIGDPYGTTPTGMVYILATSLAKSVAFFEDEDRQAQLTWVHNALDFMTPSFRHLYVAMSQMQEAGADISDPENVLRLHKTEGSA